MMMGVKIAIALIALFVFAAAAQEKPLLKDDIVRMVQQGIPTATIIETIKNAPLIGFTATAEDRAQLERQGVPKEVTQAMLDRTYKGERLVPFEQPRGHRGSQTTAAGPRQQQSSEAYGIHPGSVIGQGGGGFLWGGIGGLKPHGEGGIVVGLHRYFGVFGQGGFSQLLNERIVCNLSSPVCTGGVRANMKYFAGGAEVVASGRSRMVPYGRVGYAYTRGGVSLSAGDISVGASVGVNALVFGGGARYSIRRKFGLFGDVSMFHFVGPYGHGSNMGILSFGMFAQSK